MNGGGRLRRIRDSKLVNPWKRMKKRYSDLSYFAGRTVNPSKKPFNFHDVNKCLDVYTKRAVLKASPSIVALISYSGGKEAFWGSGVIFGSYYNNTSLCYYVLTSATLLKPPASHGCDNAMGFYDTPIKYKYKHPRKGDKDYYCLPVDEKIGVYFKGGNLCQGTVVTYDHHYNIAVLTFQSDTRLPCAVLRPLDDSSFDVNVKASLCTSPYVPVKLLPGDAVIALGRFGDKEFQVMAAPGKYSDADNIKLNCMELFRSDCKITKCGIGGPVITCAGEVVGISFYAEHCTPFLPINIFLKWWSHYEVTRSHCRPSLGMKVGNLHTADLGTLDQVQKLGISQGLIVNKILSGSPAHICGLRPRDVVFKCSDTIVVSPLQFFEIIWDMAGKVVEVVVVRKGSYINLKIEVKDVTSEAEFHQWLLPRAYPSRSRE